MTRVAGVIHINSTKKLVSRMTRALKYDSCHLEDRLMKKHPGLIHKFSQLLGRRTDRMWDLENLPVNIENTIFDSFEAENRS